MTIYNPIQVSFYCFLVGFNFCIKQLFRSFFFLLRSFRTLFYSFICLCFLIFIDWTARSLSKNAQQEPHQHHHHHHHHHHRHHHQRHQAQQKTQNVQPQPQYNVTPQDYFYGTEDEQQNDGDGATSSVDAAAVNELSELLLAELRAAKTRNLTCTEVSLPSDLTQRIATDIVLVSEREPCGTRGCTVFVEYEEDVNSVKRIAKLKLDPEMVSTFEVYLTLRQDKKGWTSLLPQFIKGLSRTVTISPDYTINKRKLYSHDSN